MHVRIMKALVLFLLVCVGNCSANAVAENDKQADGEAFKTNRIQLGSEEVYIVNAADGTPLATIDVVLDEGYEIELTPDGSKCRLSQVRDNSSCFSEVPLADKPVSARISDRCKGREIVTLKPADCGPKSGLKGDAPIRGKRATCYTKGYREDCVIKWFIFKECSTVEYTIKYTC